MRGFARLFAGRADAYGTYQLSGDTKASGKVDGRGTTHHKPLTEEVWEDHLSGKKMMGVVPIKLDGTVCWFAGDIDVYNINHADLVRKVISLEIPVVVCRSKSGGAHLYCFVNGDIGAEDAIALMRHWVTQLGYPKCEVFPKQEWVTEQSVGNWINLPYFGGDNTERYAYGLSGERLDLSQFEQMANATSATAEELKDMLRRANQPRAPSNSKPDDPLEDAPPCIQRMFEEGIGEGSRNNALAHVGIFWLKSDTDHWRENIVDSNYKLFDDPLPMDEVRQIQTNISKGKYEYLCNIEPACSLCDKEVCLTRKWGVGPQRGIDYAKSAIDRIIKINSDPPLFYVIINGTTVKMSTDQLLSPGKFRRRVYEVTGLLLAPMKERQHEARIQSAKMDVEEAPKEIGADGQVVEAFEAWCEVHLPSSRRIEEVLRGNPYYDREANEIVFKSTDFISAIKRMKKFNVADRDVWAALRDLGARDKNRSIGGRQTKVWTYPVEKPWFDLPDSEAF